MMCSKFPRWFQFGLLFLVGQLSLLTGATALKAEIKPDGTLSSESIFRDNTISGGVVRGPHLFHSFEEFDIDVNDNIYFSNPEGIENILSRVTGSNSSNIDGLLGVEGTANLFLLNPNGIIFGPNARLDIPGSFTASTAEMINFSDGSLFGVADTQLLQTLEISVPLGVQFNVNTDDNSINSAEIITEGNLTTSGDLTLSASRLNLKAPVQTGRSLTLQAANGVDSPNQYFTGENFIVEVVNELNRNSDFSARLENSEALVIRAGGNVRFVDYGGPSLNILAGGSVTVLEDITINNLDPQNTISVINGGQSNTEETQPASLDIRAGVRQDALNIPEIQGISPTRRLPNAPETPSVERASLNSAAITIGTRATNGHFLTGKIQTEGGGVFLTNQYQPDLSLVGNIEVGRIDTAQFSENGGNVVISSRGNIESTGLLSDTDLTAELNGGFINTSGRFSNTARAGDIELTAADSIILKRPSQISFRASFGDDDVVTTDASEVLFLNDFVSAETRDGQPGTITLSANNNIALDGPITFNTSTTEDQGGDINISAGENLAIINGAQLRANTSGVGNAGNITLTATNSIRLEGTRSTIPLSEGEFDETEQALSDLENLVASGAFSQVQPDASGNGGSIVVNTRLLSVLNGAQISSITNGRGHAGSISIEATDSAIFKGVGNEEVGIGRSNGSAGYSIDDSFAIQPPSGAFSSVRRTAIVDENVRNILGNVTINTADLQLKDGARLTSSTSGVGNAGSVNINADTIVMSGGGPNQTEPGAENDFSGGISILVQGEGEGGSINLDTGTLEVADGIVLATLSRGDGDAGDVNIKATGDVAFSDSFVLSELQAQGAGAGGNINIVNAETVGLDNTQFLTSSAGDGNAGDVVIDQVDALILRRGSLIQAGASDLDDGGNVDIDADFVVTVPNENNDILANAREGTGGNIDITANRIIGFQVVEQFSDALRNNSISDISASSELGTQGEVTLNNLTVDPNQGLAELPGDPSDPANQIARGCGTEAIADLSADDGPSATSNRTAGEFTITGRGGRPSSPTDMARDNSFLDDLGPSVIQSGSSIPPTAPQPIANAPTNEPLADSQHAVMTPSGEVFLVASGDWHAALSCSALR